MPRSPWMFYRDLRGISRRGMSLRRTLAGGSVLKAFRNLRGAWVVTEERGDEARVWASFPRMDEARGFIAAF